MFEKNGLKIKESNENDVKMELNKDEEVVKILPAVKFDDLELQEKYERCCENQHKRSCGNFIEQTLPCVEEEQKEDYFVPVRFMDLEKQKELLEVCGKEFNEEFEKDYYKPELFVINNTIVAQTVGETKDLGGIPAVAFYQVLDSNDEQGKKILGEIVRGKYKIGNINDHSDIKEQLQNLAKEKDNSIQKKKLDFDVTQMYETIIGDYIWSDGWTCILGKNNLLQKLFSGRIEFEKITQSYNRRGELQQELWVLEVKTESDKRKFTASTKETLASIIKGMRMEKGLSINHGCENDIQNLIRLLASRAKIEKLYIESGWQKINGKWCYLHDRKFEINTCKTGNSLLTMPDISPRQIFEDALAVFDDKSLAGPVLLYSLLGVTYNLFTEARHRPTTLLFIAGRTGSLKTATAKVFYRIFNTNEDQSLHTFQSTTASLEPLIQNCVDETLLLDDFCTNTITDSNLKSMMLRTLDAIIRFFGDASGKRKSNKNGELIEMERPRGGAVITGEITADAQSSILRMIILEFDGFSINRSALEKFQNQPYYWSTFINKYILFLEQHYHNLVSHISQLYSQYRVEAINYSISEGRSRDHYVELRILCDFLTMFLQEQGLPDDILYPTIDILMKGVVKHVRSSENRAKNVEPIARVLIAINRVIENVTLANNVQSFNEKKGGLGYRSGGDIYLKKALFEDYVEQELKFQGFSLKTMGEKWENIRKRLSLDYGILVRFKNGDRNYCYATKIGKGENRCSAYVIHEDVLKQVVRRFDESEC